MDLKLSIFENPFDIRLKGVDVFQQQTFIFNVSK